jgi:Ca-activated chloride channel homolog
MHDGVRTNVHQLSGARQRTCPDPRRGRSIGALSAVVIAAAITVAIAAAPATLEPQATFRRNIDLVNIGVTVAGENRRLITDLRASDFAVYEDGKPQQISAFVSGLDAGPALHVGVLLDVSGSMEIALPFTQAAVIKFLQSLPDAVDTTFIPFASQVSGARYTQTDFPLLVEDIRHLQANGETALYDAIGAYLDGADEQEGRKVMVLYTDGADTRSSLTLKKLMKRLKASDATVYAIGAFGDQLSAAHMPQRAELAKISEATGGAAFFPNSVQDLDRIYEQVLREVRAQYTIGYISTNERTDGAWRKVDIKITRVDGKGLHLRARKGYYARP